MTAPLSPPSAAALSAAGLCASCTYRRVVESARGSVFVMCGLAKTRPHYEKYPRLPVMQCDGHAPAGTDGD
ncbi:MAG TPA: hypothetical protein QGI62_07680 [Anaerolineales bacterium]|jgi:hypothetical protein|nr:hypothetical protein [Anaerolineales bacterium]